MIPYDLQCRVQTLPTTSRSHPSLEPTLICFCSPLHSPWLGTQGKISGPGTEGFGEPGMDPHCIPDGYNTSAAGEVRGVSCKWAVVTVPITGTPFIHPHFVVSPPPLTCFPSVPWDDSCHQWKICFHFLFMYLGWKAPLDHLRL